MKTFRTLSQQAAAPAKSGARRHRSLVRLLMPLCVGLILCTTVANANATIAIYLYGPDGPVNVTTTDSYQGSHVYDAYGNLVGTVNPDDQIYSPSGDLIGYIEEDGD
jgi:YD repeat-containing protein